jgi:hypothetical protein
MAVASSVCVIAGCATPERGANATVTGKSTQHATAAGGASRAADTSRTIILAAAPKEVDTVRYDLVLQNGQPLPQSDSNPYMKCQDTTFAAQYRFVGTNWRHWESLSRQCSPHLVVERTGTSRKPDRKGIVILRFRRAEDADHMELNFDQIEYHGDTIVAAGGDYGPERIYVRRH